MVLGFKWSVEKQWVAKILQGIREIFFHENNGNYNNYKFSHKFAFIPFLSFRRNLKQESNFQQVGGLVTRNVSVLCLGLPNSIDFYKWIPARIIAPNKNK